MNGPISIIFYMLMSINNQNQVLFCFFPKSLKM